MADLIMGPLRLPQSEIHFLYIRRLLSAIVRAMASMLFFSLKARVLSYSADSSQAEQALL